MPRTAYITRTQTILVVKPSHPLFNTIDGLSFQAKNIYNSALYICRQNYFKNKKLVSYPALNSIHKSTYTSDYKSLSAKTTQQILMVVSKNMKSFINATKDFNKNPQKYSKTQNSKIQA